MAKIKLQSGLPIPPTDKPPRESKYPFADMGIETNNTFFVAGAKSNTVHSAITRFTSTEAGKDKKFSVRTVHEVVEGEEAKGEQEGVRVWRVQ
jgi:hypothetical protein